MIRWRLCTFYRPLPRGALAGLWIGLWIGSAVCATAAQAADSDAGAEKGLASLNDDRLLTELASRGLDELLEHAFDRDRISEPQRKGIRALSALGKSSGDAATLSDTDRRQRIEAIRNDIELGLPALNDPQLLMREAALLISLSAERDANTLEYWGESARLQSMLRPVAQTVLNLLDRAVARIDVELKQAAAGIKQTDDPAAKHYLQIDQLKTTAVFTRQMASYYLVLALDRSSRQRKEMATAALTALREYDDADSTVQPAVRNRIAKLLIARGDGNDVAEARKLLEDVAELRTKPPADLSQQYEARFFQAVAALTDRDAAAAEAALESLATWQQGNVPADRMAGAEAALYVLRYRVASLQADDATADAQQKYRDAAVAALLELLQKQPALRDVIQERILDRLPPDADVKTLDPLALQALMRRGEQATHAEGKADMAALQRALAAADELIARTGQPLVSDDEVAVASLLRGLLLEKIGKAEDAVVALIDFAAKYSTNANAGFALDRAMAILQPMLGGRGKNQRINELYGRVLEVAVGAPFNRNELAYAYGRYLQEQGKHREAIEAFSRVPPDNALATAADYQRMIAIRGLLAESKLGDEERSARFKEVRDLAAAISQIGEREGATAEQKTMGVQATLLAADIASRDQKDPAGALQLLDQFEARVKGMDRQRELMADALFIRIDANMALGQFADAADQLGQLLDLQPQGKGERILQELLQRIDVEFRATAQTRGDANVLRLADARARLAKRMASWAAVSDEPRVRGAAFQYAMFAAGAAREAAVLIADPADRAKSLRNVMKMYDAIAAPGPQDEPAITLARADVLYEMGKYEEAQPIYAQLLNDRSLGAASTQRDGQTVENELYWEAHYKLLKSVEEMARQSPDKYAAALNNAKASLARLYILNGDAVGGTKWSAAFKALREELLPGWKPDAARP